MKKGVLILALGISVALSDDGTDTMKDPKKALIYSVVPGLGQIYNERYAKAAIIVGLEGYYIATYLAKHQSINDGSLSGEDALRSRNLFAWLVLGVYVMNLIDAYVDAHLSSFPKE